MPARVFGASRSAACVGAPPEVKPGTDGTHEHRALPSPSRRHPAPRQTAQPPPQAMERAPFATAVASLPATRAARLAQSQVWVRWAFRARSASSAGNWTEAPRPLSSMLGGERQGRSLRPPAGPACFCSAVQREACAPRSASAQPQLPLRATAPPPRRTSRAAAVAFAARRVAAASRQRLPRAWRMRAPAACRCHRLRPVSRATTRRRRRTAAIARPRRCGRCFGGAPRTGPSALGRAAPPHRTCAPAWRNRCTSTACPLATAAAPPPPPSARSRYYPSSNHRT